MRVMVIVKANPQTEAGELPSEEILAAMARFNEDLARAGVLLAAEGLHPSARGVRVRFANGRSSLIEGPFAGTRELVGGFWLWQVKSLDEAVEWVRRSPFRHSREELEIRRVFDAEDFDSTLSPELVAPPQHGAERITRN